MSRRGRVRAEVHRLVLLRDVRGHVVDVRRAQSLVRDRLLRLRGVRVVLRGVRGVLGLLGLLVLSGLLGVEPPPVVPYAEAEKDLSEMARTFWRDNRRVKNRRLKDELGVRLAYPDYRAGLKAIMEGGG